LLELIASKREGRAVVAPEAEAPAQVTDLMSALRASIEAARKRKGGAEPPAAAKRAEPEEQKQPAKTAADTGDDDHGGTPKRAKPGRRKRAA
jgi:DNA end-binding protein Ku